MSRQLKRNWGQKREQTDSGLLSFFGYGIPQHGFAELHGLNTLQIFEQHAPWLNVDVVIATESKA